MLLGQDDGAGEPATVIRVVASGLAEVAQGQMPSVLRTTPSARICDTAFFGTLPSPKNRLRSVLLMLSLRSVVVGLTGANEPAEVVTTNA